jgi:DHA2 family multidrug resistance protein
VSYAFLPPGKNNAASGLINLARNVGGSVGISFVITMLARRTQVHQTNLTHNLTAGSGQYQAMINNATHILQAHGSNAAEAARQAQGLVASTLNQQATMLAYIDNFWMLGLAASCMIPLVFLMKKAKPGGPMAVH